jgi:hypothetical protein
MRKKREASVTPQSTQELRLEHWPIDRVVPSARNARTHSQAQIAEIAGSIRAFGFTNPILVGDAGDVIVGHGRLAAARQLGLGMVPVIPLEGLTEMQRRQLMLADNRIALNAGWDLDMLKLELKDLSAIGADLFDFRSAEGQTERLPQLAAELVKTGPDVIVAGFGTATAKAAQAATTTIPVVFTSVGDPIGTGIVKSLNRPGANLTGMHAQATDISGKRLQILEDIAPGIRTIAVLLNQDAPLTTVALPALRIAAYVVTVGQRVTSRLCGHIG